jgi:hypothetical protein
MTAMFSQSFLQFLIVAALAWTALGALTLIALLLRDRKNGTLW